MITRKELIKKYLEFFEKNGHYIIQNSSLMPENDPSVLFTTSGMHPLVPYLLGQKHPAGKKLAGIQKCIRTSDIDLVGDKSHNTFFEMLGNWSLGDYWKEEAIKMSYEFLTKELKIQPKKISITCFKGDKDAKKDDESARIWKSLGINKIKFLGKKNNWWGPAGETGPCGPDTEMFVDDFEIWNDVFMEYKKTKDGKYACLAQKNVDTGMGVERTLAVLNNLNDGYLTDSFYPIIQKIEKISGKKYGISKETTKAMRIIADHLKASIFIISDGVIPSNTEQGYVLRRLIRRAVRYGKIFGMKKFLPKIAESVFEIYNDYPKLQKNKEEILKELEKEENKFEQTLENGLERLKFMIKGKRNLSGKDAFLLYQSYGFPIELTSEIVKEKRIKINIKEYESELNKHQKLSRTSAKGKFKSGLADSSEKTIKLHTATHLLLAALREVLKDENILQKGSNITSERLRLDFSFSRKLTEEEIKIVEDLVNAKIQQSCEVERQEMSPNEAKKKGALGIFGEKYGEKVSVYKIENFSQEICSGPHVKNTCKLGHFKIIKEESSSAGVRRIKAVLN
jgi:alanyl-tRNA synthetase